MYLFVTYTWTATSSLTLFVLHSLPTNSKTETLNVPDIILVSEVCIRIVGVINSKKVTDQPNFFLLSIHLFDLVLLIILLKG